MKHIIRYKHFILVFLIVINIMIIALNAGCWSRRELDHLAIVSGIGIDFNDDVSNSPQVRLTAEIIRPQGGKQNSGSGGSNSSEKAFLNLQSTGKSVFDALRNFTLESSRRLYISHNELLVFGYDVAKDGVRDYLDFFTRDYETRRNTWVIISRNKASDIFAANEGLENVTARKISRIIETAEATSQIAEVDLQEFLQRMLSKSRAPVAPIMDVTQEEGKNKKVFVSGTAVFNRDRLVGELDRRETRGLLWVTGEVRSGIVTVDCPGNEGKISIEILGSESKITPQVNEDNIVMNVSIRAEGNIGGQMCSESLASNQAMKIVEQEFSNAIKQEVFAALQKARELNADIFGFGDVIYKKDNSIWKAGLDREWQDYFNAVEVNVIPETKILRTGLITKTPKPE